MFESKMFVSCQVEGETLQFNSLGELFIIGCQDVFSFVNFQQTVTIFIKVILFAQPMIVFKLIFVVKILKLLCLKKLE